MKWDIDKALQGSEPEQAPGTCINRVSMDLASMRNFGVVPTAEQTKIGFGNVWSLGLGYIHMPKAFFYGHTIRACFLQARKAIKTRTLAKHTPWGVQPFEPVLKKKKPRDKKGAKGRQKPDV